jgi:hypothetical protein
LTDISKSYKNTGPWDIVVPVIVDGFEFVIVVVVVVDVDKVENEVTVVFVSVIVDVVDVVDVVVADDVSFYLVVNVVNYVF